MATRIVIAVIAIIAIIAAVIWINRGEDETATPVLSVTAFNQTKNAPAADVATTPDDSIVYTLTAHNQSDEAILGYIIEANISEITNNATLIDAAGASYNSGTNSLVWTPLDIQPNESISQTFTVRVNPNTANQSLRILFNNELVIPIQQSTVSGNNTTNPGTTPTYVAPTSGAAEWIPVVLAVLVTSFVAYRRLRLGITTQS